MHATYGRFLSLAASLVLLGAGAGVAKEAVKEPPRMLVAPFIEREQVRFVTVDLIVDEKRRGGWRRSSGIRKEQVRLFLDGKPVVLDTFEATCPPNMRAATKPDRRTERDGTRKASTQTSRTPRTVARAPIRYILYFDFTHLKHEGYRLAYKAALEWADATVRPTDEVMIVTGAASLRIVRPLAPAGEGFRELLLASMDDYLASDNWAHQEDLVLNGRIAEVRRIRDWSGVLAAEQMANTYAVMDTVRTRRSLRNLEALMTLFESVDGTRNLILFQQTMRLFPGVEYPYVSRPGEVETELEHLARAANERGVRIYPVDAGGLQRYGGVDSAMTMLASETGGRCVERTNDLGFAFQHVEEDSMCSYRLGFRVRSEFRGASHKIRVAVEGDRRYRLRHRRTLYDATREERNTQRIQAALLDPSTATALHLLVSSAPLSGQDGVTRIRLQVEVPLQEMLALRAGASGERQIRLQMGGSLVPVQPDHGAQEGPGGAWSDVDQSREAVHWSESVVLRVNGDLSRGNQPFTFTRDLDVPPGAYRAVAVIQDQLAGVLGGATHPVQVSAGPGRRR